MTMRPWLWSLLMLASWVVLPAHAFDRDMGQGSSTEDKRQKSHLLDLPGPADDLEGLLAKHGKSARNPEDLVKRLQQNGIDPEILKRIDPKLLARLGQMNRAQLEEYKRRLELLPSQKKSDPKALQQAVKDLLPDEPQPDRAPEAIEAPKNSQSKKAEQENPKKNERQDDSPAASPNPAESANNPGSPPDTATPMGAASNGQTPPGPPPGTSVGGTAPAGGNLQAQAGSGAFKERLLNFAERLQRVAPSLRNSPSLRRAVEQLGRHLGEEDKRWDRLATGATTLQEKMQSWGQSLGMERLQNLSWPRALSPSSLPRIRWPNAISSLAERPPLPTLPSRSAAPASGGWGGFLAVGGLLVFGFLLWRFLSRWSYPADSKGAGAWKLGPWPVQPAAIRTREELIRAFEYLSVLNLGPAARHWNHRAIAGRLGNVPAILSEEFYRRLAAEELANFYERARYAPEKEPLPEEALAAARHDLCLLAGMPAA